MRGRVVLGLVATVALGLTVVANEKPSTEFQNIMKSNGATNGSLLMHIMAKDYDGVAADAATLKGNFAQADAFWTAKKVDDTITFSKAGSKAAADLETAAKAKNDDGIAAAQKSVAATCGGCHMAHRDQLPDKSFEIK